MARKAVPVPPRLAPGLPANQTFNNPEPKTSSTTAAGDALKHTSNVLAGAEEKSLSVLPKKDTEQNVFVITARRANRPAPAINYVVSFILVGLAWGLTTPFIRRAARTHKPAPHPLLDSPAVKQSWLRSRLYGAFFAVLDLLRNPRYAVPLVLNLTGSVWFFLLIGKAELSLTVPIVNAMAFLFTVLGEWFVEGKVISRGMCKSCHPTSFNVGP
ncbi:hypothetical protein TrVFT333_005619 [Trichoderma virens FT-333]|nr:hypothetical protein TrVFT333_005619 [Trichoderma virens FT-333]